jgi:hypothetical protein
MTFLFNADKVGETEFDGDEGKCISSSAHMQPPL